MPQDLPLEGGATPPPAALLQMMTGYWISQAVYVAAKFGVADHLADGPVDHGALAAATGANPDALHRLLRALSSVGVFGEPAPGHSALSPLGTLLRTGTPDSMRALAITYNEEQYRCRCQHSAACRRIALAGGDRSPPRRALAAELRGLT